MTQKKKPIDYLRDVMIRSLHRKGVFPSLAFWLPVLISVGICIYDQVYPFGDQCILHMDMYHQYCPFFTELMNKLKNGGSLLYSWRIGLGSDFFSVFVYYLASPLNWLILLCPKSHVIEFMSLLIIVKIGFCGLGFFCFLREHFRLVGEGGYSLSAGLWAVVFSCAYAFSGFVAAYSWDIMWMDCVALAPVILLGLERLVRKGQPVLYYLTLSLSILCNYYLSIMICIFLVFDFFWLFFSQEEGRLKALFRFAWYSLLAGGTGLIMMLPEMLVLSYSGSSGISWPDAAEWYFDLIREMSRMCVTADVYESTAHWPNLYAGVFSILLVVLYAFNRRISREKRITHLAMVIFFLISFASNWLDFFWHGLHFPDSLPGRQSFLFAFLVLVMGYECLREADGLRLPAIIGSAVFCVGLMLASSYLTDDEITSVSAGWLTAAFLIFYAGILICGRLSSAEEKRFLRGLAMVVALAEVIFNMEITGFYTTSRTSYMEKTDSYEELLQMAEEDAMEQAGTDDAGAVFFRVEDTNRKTKNDDALYGYASATQFSSLMDINVSHFYQSVFMEGGKNYYCFNGSTPLTAAMLSVGYRISENPDEESSLWTLVGSADGEYLYRNLYSLPLGYVLSEETATACEDCTLTKIDKLNYLAQILGASGDMLEDRDVTSLEEDGCTTIHIPADGFYYAYYDSCSSDSLDIVHENGYSTHYSKASHKYLFDLGWCTEGEQVQIKNRKSETISFHVCRLRLTSVKEAYRTLSDTPFQLEEYTDTSVTGSVNMTEAGRLIFSIPAETGWTLTVDGAPCEIQAFDDTFISVSLSAGQHTIALHYQTPGLWKGAAGSGVCLLLFLITMAIRRRRSSENSGKVLQE